MAKRYRYSFVKTKEAEKGKLSVGLAAASLILLWEVSAFLQLCFLPTGSFWDY